MTIQKFVEHLRSSMKNPNDIFFDGKNLYLYTTNRQLLAIKVQ